MIWLKIHPEVVPVIKPKLPNFFERKKPKTVPKTIKVIYVFALKENKFLDSKIELAKDCTNGNVYETIIINAIIHEF